MPDRDRATAPRSTGEAVVTGFNDGTPPLREPSTRRARLNRHRNRELVIRQANLDDRLAAIVVAAIQRFKSRC